MVSAGQVSIPLRVPWGTQSAIFDFKEPLMHRLGPTQLPVGWPQLNVQPHSSLGPQRNYLEMSALRHGNTREVTQHDMSVGFSG